MHPRAQVVHGIDTLASASKWRRGRRVGGPRRLGIQWACAVGAGQFFQHVIHVGKRDCGELKQTKQTGGTLLANAKGEGCNGGGGGGGLHKRSSADILGVLPISSGHLAGREPPPHHPITPPPNHPTTQSPHHPTTPPPNHPITQSPNHPITPQANRPTTQPPHHPTTPPSNHPTAQSPHRQARLHNVSRPVLLRAEAVWIPYIVCAPNQSRGKRSLRRAPPKQSNGGGRLGLKRSVSVTQNTWLWDNHRNRTKRLDLSCGRRQHARTSLNHTAPIVSAPNHHSICALPLTDTTRLTRSPTSCV